MVIDEGQEGRKEGSEGREWKGRKDKIVENSKRNDLRERRNKAAEHYDLSDIKTFHPMEVIGKIGWGKAGIKKYA